MGPTRAFFCRSTLFAAALLAALPAAADMFKWVDENGVVTYSNTPPTAKQPKKVEAVPERVSVYTPDPQLNKAMSPDPARDAKIAKLEKQLEAERRSRQAAAQPSRTPASERQVAAYERCVADRGVDCESILNGTSVSHGAGYPYVVVGARTPVEPFAVLSTPNSVIGINPAPPVGISTAPKVGAQPPRNIRSNPSIR
jgi:hypothetical protein